MPHKILVINSGATSTKVAFYEGNREIFIKNVDHSAADLEKFDDILEQLDFRTEVVKAAVREWQIDLRELSAVIGRGNMLPHMEGGGYIVEENMIRALKAGLASPHASNLAALIAYSLAQPLGIPAYIYDSVTADEFPDIAKITGIPGVKRKSMSHVLNQKAMARKYAASVGKKYEEIDLIVVHLGSGVSIGVHHHGRIVDAIRDDAGPFSPERAGSIPLLYVIDMCYSGKYTKKEMIKFIRGSGGMKAYLGTADIREIEKRIEGGDVQAKAIYEAQAYQIAKGIGEMAPVLSGRFDAIILTGGMAYSKRMTEMIEDRVRFIAPVVVLPGESEMEALALGANRILDGEPIHTYQYRHEELEP